MDECGFVNDLDLAKSILIMYFSNKFILERELVTKIKNELVEIEGGFTFINPDGYYHFGGPDQMDGYVIRELEGWLKEYKEISEGDSHLMLNWLNKLDVVFYEIEGELKCFVLNEFD